MSFVERIILLTNYYVYGFKVSSTKVQREIRLDLAEDFAGPLKTYIEQDRSQATKIIVNVLEEEMLFEKIKSDSLNQV